jgi:glucosamine--fructose-6-phosphate aminotransferase (isomerizing)
VGISQSGSAPDVAAVIAAARRAGAFTVALTNARRSRLARAAEATFDLECGPERAVAATKTYTASCLVLALLASATAAALSLPTIAFDRVEDAVREATASARDAGRLARKIGSRRMLVVLGRGYDYAAALEGALKIKELARVWAEPYSSADFAHGPRTLLEKDTAVLLFASRGVMLREANTTAAWLHDRGARVYAITNDEHLAERCDDAVVLRTRCAEAVAPIALSVVAQHLARAVAIRHGRDPERPVGISKVTRTL